MSDSQKLIKNTTIYALGDIIPKLLAFISFPILTRYLTPSDYGIVNYVNTLSTFLIAFGFLCINTYYLVFYYRCTDELERKKLLGNLTSFIILLNVIIVFALLFFGKYLFSALGSNISFFPFICIAIFSNFFNIFSILPSALYRLLEKPLYLTIINISKGVITLILTMALVVFWNFTALGVLYANLIVNFIFAFIFLYTTRKHIIWNLSFSQLKTVLAFSLPLVPGTLAYNVTTISDRILIDKYLTLNDLGIYSTAATLALVLSIFSYGAYKAFEPHIFKNWNQDGFLKSFENIRNGFMYVLLIGAGCLSIFSKEFFQILTDVKYHKAYLYVPLIIIGVYSSSIGMLYSTIITAKEKTKINSMISITGACISIVLNVMLLPKYGLIIAALVSSFAMSIMLFIQILYSKIKIDHYRPALAFLFTAVSIYFLVYRLNIEYIGLSILFKLMILILMLIMLSKIVKINPFNFIKKKPV